MDPVRFWLRFSHDVNGSHKHNSLFSIFFQCHVENIGEQLQADHHGKKGKNAHNLGRWVHVGCTLGALWPIDGLQLPPWLTGKWNELKSSTSFQPVDMRGNPHLGDLRTRVLSSSAWWDDPWRATRWPYCKTHLWTVGAQKTPACYWYRGGSSDGKDAGSKDVLGVSFTRTWCSGCSVSLSRLDQPSMIWFLSRFQTCDLAPSFHHFSR